MSGPEVDITITGNSAGARAAVDSVGEGLKGVGEKAASTAFKFNQITDALKKVRDYAKSAFDTLLGDSVRIANQIDKMNKQFGVATDTLQRLGYAAKQEHGSLEGVGNALKFLNKNLGEAAGGSQELQDAFARIGISAQDLATAKPEEVLLRLADVMADKTIPQSEKTALAMKLMGRGAVELAPMLALGRTEIERLGKEAEKLGVVMSAGAIAGAEQFDDAMTLMSEGLQGVKNTILEALAPALSEFAHWVGETIPPFVEGLRADMLGLYDTMGGIADVIAEVVTPAWDAFTESLSLATEQIGELTGMAEFSLAGLDSFADVILGVIEVVMKFVSNTKSGFESVIAVVEHWSRVVGITFMEFFKGLGKSAGAVGDLFVALGKGFIDGFKALFDIVVASGKGIWEGFKAALSGGSFSDAFMGEFDKALDGINQRALQRAKELSDSWDKIDIFGGLSDALESEKKRYEDALADIGDANEEERKHIEDLISEIDKKIDARKREREATRAAADAEAKAKEEARALAAAHRDLAGALDGTANAARGVAGAMGAMGSGGPNATSLDWSSRSPNPEGGGAGGGFGGGDRFGAMTRLGSSLTRGSQVWGINLDEVRTFRTRAEAERFAARENLRRQHDQDIRNLNDRTDMTGRERREALAAMRRQHKEEMDNLKKKQKEEQEGKKKQKDQDAKDKQKEKDKEKAGGGTPPKPPPPSPPPPPPKDATDGMKKLEDATKKTEDAKKSLAENIKSEFKASVPSNATGAIKTSADAMKDLGDATKTTDDAVKQLQDDIRKSFMTAQLTTEGGGSVGGGAAAGGGAVGSGGGGGGGGAGAKGGAGSADDGGKAGDGGKGGAGGGGGQGSTSSGGGGGGAGGSGGGGGKGGDATINIGSGGMSLYGPGISDAAAVGLARARARWMSGVGNAQLEHDEIARSGDPIAMAAFLRRHPEFAGQASTSMPSPDVGAVGGAGGTGGATMPGPSGRTGGLGGSIPSVVMPRIDRATIDIDRGGVFVRPDPAMMDDIAKYRGGFALPSKVEEISRALSGGGKFGGAPVSTGTVQPGGIGSAGTVNQDIDVKVDMSGMQVKSEYDIKELANDLGKQITGSLKTLRQAAI